ncbi:clan AA aspartic protease [Methylophaga sp. 42_25_T18]|nr:clan AA aspartic protease [Methylophaga sp. 42_25_T18]OUR87798.1 clan AA aspartic protease [Methylophaga sp. 42_8_T64]
MYKIWLLGLIILLNTSLVWADELKIVVVGLFSGQAVVEINHKQRLLKVGKTSPEGVTLISATSQSAVLEIDGQQKKYLLGSHIGGKFSPPPAQPVVSLWPTNGMYITPGTVNGYTVDFLVDTGASAIALNAETAKRLDLDYINNPPIGVKTASGITHAYPVKLDEVQVGDIKLYNVQAMVIDGPEPSRALLGMTFLGQLDMLRSGERMDLKQKY